MAKGEVSEPIRAGEATLTLSIPGWARFGWPAATGD